MTEKVSIVIVDDHPIFRSGLVQTLALEPGFSVVAEGSSAEEAVALVRAFKPDILLLDVSMSDSGIDRIAQIMTIHPQVRVIVVTASQNDNDIARALEAGVPGYVLKGTTGRELIDIVHLVHAGQSYISPRAMSGLWAALKGGAGHDEHQAQIASLSRQEVHVLRLVAQGLNNKEIGAQLGVTEKTVKFHLSNVFAKLHVRNRVEASILARQAWADLQK
jgi:two-component system, NarL family, nitrate/nitrite response regulator NarL